MNGCPPMPHFDEEEMGYFLILFTYFESKLFFAMGKNQVINLITRATHFMSLGAKFTKIMSSENKSSFWFSFQSFTFYAL